MRRPGALSETIRFESYTTTADGPFLESDGWSTHTTARASIVPVMGREDELAQSQRVTAKYRITMRKISGITGDMRIVWTSNGDKTLNIRELPDPGTRSLYMEIYATEGGAD